MVKKKSKRTRSRKAIKQAIRKRRLIIEWLNECGFDFDEQSAEKDIIEAAYALIGWRAKYKEMDFPSMHARYSSIIGGANLGPRYQEIKATPVQITNQDKKWDQTKRFYRSYEWKKLRYQILKRDNRTCLLCGATAGNGVVLNVDHIKPLKKFWSLRLDPENLQTLCGECNHGKGNWDETNWRLNLAKKQLGEI